MKKYLSRWYLLWFIGFLTIGIIVFTLIRNGLEQNNQILLLAVMISFFSLSLSLYVTNISRSTARAETFRQLRAVFFEFRQDLPDDWNSTKNLPDGGMKSPEFKIMVRYWQYAFDEWLITTRLNPRIMRPLWDRYYEGAIRNSASCPPMLVALFHSYHTPGPITDEEFVREMINLASEDSRRNAVRLAKEHHCHIPAGFGLEKYS